MQTRADFFTFFIALFRLFFFAGTDIRIQQRTGRKSLTTISGLPQGLDFERLVRTLKKNFSCNGVLVKSPELGTVVQLQGDQRKNVTDFLVKEKIIKRSQIKIHGC